MVDEQRAPNLVGGPAEEAGTSAEQLKAKIAQLQQQLADEEAKARPDDESKRPVDLLHEFLEHVCARMGHPPRLDRILDVMKKQASPE